MSKNDTHFFNVFSVVLGLLIAFAILVFAFARYVGKHEQRAQVLNEPMLQSSVQQRTALPARVAVAGQDNSALKIEAATSQAGPAAVLATYKTGPEVYEGTCKVCHEAGLAGAPKSGDAAVWAPRIAKGKATLYEHALKGFTGTTGVMPPKGGHTYLSDELVKEAVDHIIAL